MTDQTNHCNQHDAIAGCVKRNKMDIAGLSRQQKIDTDNFMGGLRKKVTYQHLMWLLIGVFGFTTLLFGISQSNLSACNSDINQKVLENKIKIRDTREVFHSIDKRLSNIEIYFEINKK